MCSKESCNNNQCLSVCSGDELLLTELLFNGVFNDLTHQQCCALVSCFVFQENAGSETPKLTEELSGPLRIMQVSLYTIQIVTIKSVTIYRYVHDYQYMKIISDQGSFRY